MTANTLPSSLFESQCSLDLEKALRISHTCGGMEVTVSGRFGGIGIDIGLVFEIPLSLA